MPATNGKHSTPIRDGERLGFAPARAFTSEIDEPRGQRCKGHVPWHRGHFPFVPLSALVPARRCEYVGPIAQEFNARMVREFVLCRYGETTWNCEVQMAATAAGLNLHCVGEPSMVGLAFSKGVVSSVARVHVENNDSGDRSCCDRYVGIRGFSETLSNDLQIARRVLYAVPRLWMLAWP